MNRRLQSSLSGLDAVLITAVASAVALAALFSRVGSDSQWLAALGHVIAVRGSVPDGIPFAAAATGHWANPLVLAELIFDGLEQAFGDRGLMLVQLLAVAGALAILAHDARAGGADGIGTGAALLLAAIGALPSIAIVRVQLFSLVLFPVLIALLRAQRRAPSRRLWLVVPLIALWANLHGGVLLGFAVLIAYLAFDRARAEPLLAAGVAIASAIALCLTPALSETTDYYYGLLTNVAAQRGAGMWGPLSLSSPFDLIMVAAAGVLAFKAWRSRTVTRLPGWEVAVALALAVLTVRADRNGVWLLMFLVAPAARALRPERSLRMLAPILAACSLAVLALTIVRGPVPSGASEGIVTRAVALAHGTPVLADGSIDEQVAMAGGRIWAGNPIDAFSRPVQTEYLNWVAGDTAGTRALASDVRVVVVSRGSTSQALMSRVPGFVPIGSDATAVIYERAGHGVISAGIGGGS